LGFFWHVVILLAGRDQARGQNALHIRLMQGHAGRCSLLARFDGWGQLRRAVAVGDAVAQRVAGLRRRLRRR
jgi:hypothetical protein